MDSSGSAEAISSGWRIAPRRVVAALGGCAIGLLLIALVLITAAVNRDQDEALSRERHSYEIRVLTNSLDASLARAEAALGRFVIDGDRRTGTTFNDEWRRAGHQIAVLRQLTTSDPGQQDSVARLRTLYERRREEIRGAATSANYRQGWTALSLFARAGKTTTLAEISRLLSRIADEQRAQLDRRSDRALLFTARSNRLSAILSIFGGLLVVVALALGWQTVRALAGRRTAAEIARMETDRALVLSAAVAERTAELRAANLQLTAEIEERQLAEGLRARAEAQLRQMHKMEAVGQLTGGIAHDFNNMLSIVVGGIELARRRAGVQDADLARHLDQAMEGATRAAALTRRLLSFARAEPLLPHGVDPAELVEGMRDLIDRTIGERIVVRIEREGAPWPVWVDAYQLENAILNLAVNARDAMGGAGQLVIQLGNRTPPEGPGRGLPPGDYVRIAVIDDGCGMDAAVAERVFEPFFTTKPVGKGTGLGLSQIFAFARQSGGTVDIRSSPGMGTTVTLWLPRHAGAIASALPRATPADAPSIPQGLGQTILVVEDDPRVRAATCSALAELGYRPRATASAEEALAVLSEAPSVDLILSDVMMPTTTGPEMVRLAEQRHGPLRALFVTGYAGQGGEAEQFGGHEVLRKPFTLGGLAAAVEQALAERGRSDAA